MDARLAKYQLLDLSVLSSTPIAGRTATVSQRLLAERVADEQPCVIRLTAKAKAASKLISIVEIAKRDLASKGTKCFQYNALSSEIVDVPRERARKESNGADVADEDGSDDAFETMGAPSGTTKKRSIPIITVYLSVVPVKELKAEYG